MKIVKYLLEPDDNDKFKVDITKAEEYTVKKMDRDSGTLSNPDIIVIHYTGTLNINSDINTLFYSDKQVSVHLVIDLDGTIYQLMPLSRIAWHAGESRLLNRTNINKYSIGIEIVNPGFLTKKENGDLYTWYEKKVDSENAVLLKHKNETSERYWHTYTQSQIESVKLLCAALKNAFEIKYIVGHDDIAPNRKSDPGPAFPLKFIQNIVLDNRDDNMARVEVLRDYGQVSVDNLNIREAGNPNAKKVALPLKKGQKVQIIEEKDGWYKVETKITGWVSAQYIS